MVNHRPLTSKVDGKVLDLCFGITSSIEPIGLSSDSIKDIVYNKVYKVSELIAGDGIIECEYIKSGRFYIGYGDLAKDASGNIAPTPDGDQYFGWVEYSRVTGDTCVWINLSNVDVVGIPITLTSNTWSLGYKNSNNDLIGQLMDSFPGCSVKIGDFNKVVGPDIASIPYPSFDIYFNYLSNGKAQLSINSDTLSDQTQKIFVGGFDPDIEAISLVSNSGDTFVVYYSAITSDIIYAACGGNDDTITYNGVIVEQNRSGKTDDVICSNSVFRNIMIGLNEGYFDIPSQLPESNGINYSLNFSYFEPFRYLNLLGSCAGNMYAKIIHENSNSYGFAYADDNLKVLIQSPLNDVIEMHIIDDDTAAFNYQDDAKSTLNCPGFGDIQFVFGAGSQALGNIEIGNCNYPAATSESGLGSFLPIIDEWVEMKFNGTDGNYIKIKPSTLEVNQIYKNKDGSTGYCLSSGANLIIDNVPMPRGRKLDWGADVTWNQGAKNPD